jgi:hypothetical protein
MFRGSTPLRGIDVRFGVHSIAIAAAAAAAAVRRRESRLHILRNTNRNSPPTRGNAHRRPHTRRRCSPKERNRESQITSRRRRHNGLMTINMRFHRVHLCINCSFAVASQSVCAAVKAQCLPTRTAHTSRKHVNTATARGAPAVRNKYAPLLGQPAQGARVRAQRSASRARALTMAMAENNCCQGSCHG